MWFRTTWFDEYRTAIRERNFRRYWQRRSDEAVADELEAREREIAKGRAAWISLMDVEREIANISLTHLYGATRVQHLQRERQKLDDAISVNSGLRTVLRRIVREREPGPKP